MKELTGQKKGRVLRFGILTLMIMIVIFIFSAMDAERSGAVSGFVSNLVDYLGLGDILPNIAHQDSTEGRVRKCAHVMMYFFLGLSGSAMFKEYFFSRVEHCGYRIDYFKTLASSMAFCFLYACSDEWHQTFVPGRSGKLADVGEDAIGFVSAAVLSICITYIRNKKEIRGKKL